LPNILVIALKRFEFDYDTMYKRSELWHTDKYYLLFMLSMF
jgi:hypothetical protein